MSSNIPIPVHIPVRIERLNFWSRLIRGFPPNAYWMFNGRENIKFYADNIEGFFQFFKVPMTSAIDKLYTLEYTGEVVKYTEEIRYIKAKRNELAGMGEIEYRLIRNKETGQVKGGYDVVQFIRSTVSQRS